MYTAVEVYDEVDTRQHEFIILTLYYKCIEDHKNGKKLHFKRKIYGWDVCLEAVCFHNKIVSHKIQLF